MSACAAHPSQQAQQAQRLVCTAELQHLPALLALVGSAAHRWQVDEDVVHDLQLIAEEACVNVMHHAYPPGAPGPLSLELALRHEGPARSLVLTLQDQGRPFNPLSLAPADTDAPVEDRVPGGLGVHLIRSLSDRQHYRHDARDGNVFTIEKRLATASPS
jgi:serine/threonine-protein kinase RsbW